MKKLFKKISVEITTPNLCIFLLIVLFVSMIKHVKDEGELRTLRSDTLEKSIEINVLEAICDTLKSERDNLLFWNNYSRKANQKEISDKIYNDRKNRVKTIKMEEI